jgi:hypothetical protein
LDGGVALRSRHTDALPTLEQWPDSITVLDDLGSSEAALVAVEDVLERYESLVPTVDFVKLTRLIFSGDLSRVKQYINELAKHTFVNFWTFDPSPQMQLFGHRTRVVTYMMATT